MNFTKTKKWNYKHTSINGDKNLNISFDKININNTEYQCSKRLGILIEKRCNWKEYIDSLCNQIYILVYDLRRNKTIQN